MKVKIWVDRPKCATFASCTIATDPVFVLDDEGKAVIDMAKVKSMAGVKSVKKLKGNTAHNKFPVWVIDAEDKWVEDNITAGAQRCPVFAIDVINMDTGKKIFPES